MKKATILALILCMASASITKADSDIAIRLNGENMKFEQNPFIDDGTTLVPMRAVFEALGAGVEWDGETRTIISEKNNTTITLQIDSNEMRINDTVTILEKAPIILNDFTYVPLRAVAEAFNAEVVWDGAIRSISINIPKPTETPAPTASPLESPTPTEEPSPQGTELPAETPDASDKNYAEMYKGTGYEFVRNIPGLTSDFNEDNRKFKSREDYGWGQDYNGNGVMYLQNKTGQKAVKTTVEMMLDEYNLYEPEEFIDISFDIYCPKSTGRTEIELIGSNTKPFATLIIKKGAKKFEFMREMDFDAATYFNNNTEGEESDIIIENGAHVNILINPHGAKANVSIKNNTNNAEEQIMKEFIQQSNTSFGYSKYYDERSASIAALDSRVKLKGIKFNVNEVKPVILDNLVTNIVKLAK